MTVDGAVAVAEARSLTAEAIFDVQDRWARDRGLLGPVPRPFGALRFNATATIDAGGRTDIDPPLELTMRRNASGYDVFFGVVETEAGRRRIGPATYAVRIEGQMYQAAEREDIAIPAPAAPYRYDLEPGYAYPFPPGSTVLRGSVHQPGGEGLAGVRVSVPAVSNAYVTDATGQWVLVFPEGQPSGNVTVRFELPGDTPVDLAGVSVQAQRDSLLTQTGLRGLVIDGAGIPVRHGTVHVQGRPGESVTGPDGGWRYAFPLTQGPANVTVIARHPDGSQLSRPGVAIQPRAVVVVPTFKFV